MTPLQLKVPAQPHENRDWRGHFRHEYDLLVELPLPTFWQGEQNPILTLFVTCTPPLQQIVTGWLVQPSIVLLIKQLRRKFYPGEEEVFCFDITHVGTSQPLPAGVAAHTATTQLYMLPNWRPLSDERLRAMTKRTKYFYLQLDAEARGKLSVWLDQQYETGVLT